MGKLAITRSELESMLTRVLRQTMAGATVVVAIAERVNDFETDFGLSSGAAPTAAESRRGHGKRLRVSHTPLENPAGFPHLTAAGGNHHAIFSFSNDSGRLIQAGPGSAGGFGRPFGNRSGCSWNARSSTPWRAS